MVQTAVEVQHKMCTSRSWQKVVMKT